MKVPELSKAVNSIKTREDAQKFFCRLTMKDRDCALLSFLYGIADRATKNLSAILMPTALIEAMTITAEEYGYSSTGECIFEILMDAHLASLEDNNLVRPERELTNANGARYEKNLRRACGKRPISKRYP